MQPWTRPSRCRGDTRMHCKWWQVCWVSSKRTGTIHEQRTQANVLEVKSQELEVEHWLPFIRTVQDTTERDISTILRGSISSKKCGLSVPLHPAWSHTLSHSPIPSFLVIEGGWEATNLAPSTPEVPHSLWSASSLCFLRTLPLYTVWI